MDRGPVARADVITTKDTAAVLRGQVPERDSSLLTEVWGQFVLF